MDDLVQFNNGDHLKKDGSGKISALEAFQRLGDEVALLQSEAKKKSGPQTVGDMVREFHAAYDAYVGDEENPGFPEPEHVKMRMDLIDEEYEELHVAVAGHDIIETIDALGDLVYVLYGKALAMGVDLDKVIAEIHRSNMTKLGEDGKPIYREDMKVLKGPNFEPPDIAGVIGL